MRHVGSAVAGCLAIGLLAGSALAQQAPGPAGPEEGRFRRQAWLMPSPAKDTLMRATVFRPRGEGPFPLVVVNHGSTVNVAARASYPTPLFTAISHWFAEKGFVVVVPQRPGHGATGGPYLEDQGGSGCHERVDFRKAGLGTASSIQAAITYMTGQPFVRKDGIIVVGQSAGGWGALALASLNPPTVKAIVNFAGGRGGRSFDKPNHNCQPDRLVATAGEFGRTARTPTLWIYTENDSFFAPELSKRMMEAYRGAGGKVEYHLLPPFGSDGHELAGSRDAVPIWSPLVEKFLAGLR